VKLAQDVTGFDAGLRQVPGERLADPARAPLAESDLDGGIAVPLRRLDLGRLRRRR